MMEEETTTIMAALSTLSPSQLSHLTHSISSHLHHHRRRLIALVSSPTLFSLTLHHLHSLSLPQKTLLISRFLLSSLSLLTRHFLSLSTPLPNHPSTSAITPRDLDAAVLLLQLCEVRQHDPKSLEMPPNKWRRVLSRFCYDSMLTLSGIRVYNGAILMPYIEMVTRCLKFVGIMGGCGGGGGKVREVAASPAAVVGLPLVEVRVGGTQCVICKEEMGEGRDVCELPCQHLFHWICILPWLRKTNTCPCCRFQLPTDDVLGEIQRLWDVLIKVSAGAYGGDQRT